MAVRIKKGRRDVDEIPLASTADIAFLLIIFYLASSSLLEFRGVSLPLPVKDAPPMQILKKNIFRIGVDREGKFIYEKKPFELGEIMEKASDAFRKNPELVVILRIHPESPADRVPSVIRELQKSGIERFSMGIDR